MRRYSTGNELRETTTGKWQAYKGGAAIRGAIFDTKVAGMIYFKVVMSSTAVNVVPRSPS